ncbi:MAG: hypothetical protein V3U59_00010 [Gammaproteobacteria bacterium]
MSTRIRRGPPRVLGGFILAALCAITLSPTTAGAEDAVWAINKANARLCKLNFQTGKCKQINNDPNKLKKPTGLVARNDGGDNFVLLGTDQHSQHGKIFLYDGDGGSLTDVLTQADLGFSFAPTGPAVLPAGHLAGVNSTSVWILERDPLCNGSSASPCMPGGFSAFGFLTSVLPEEAITTLRRPDGGLCVLTQEEVSCYDPTTIQDYLNGLDRGEIRMPGEDELPLSNLDPFVDLDGLGNPTGAVFDTDGSLLVGLATNKKGEIRKFDSDGNDVGVFKNLGKKGKFLGNLERAVTDTEAMLVVAVKKEILLLNSSGDQIGNVKKNVTVNGDITSDSAFTEILFAGTGVGASTLGFEATYEEVVEDFTRNVNVCFVEDDPVARALNDGNLIICDCQVVSAVTGGSCITFTGDMFAFVTNPAIFTIWDISGATTDDILGTVEWTPDVEAFNLNGGVCVKPEYGPIPELSEVFHGTGDGSVPTIATSSCINPPQGLGRRDSIFSVGFVTLSAVDIGTDLVETLQGEVGDSSNTSCLGSGLQDELVDLLDDVIVEEENGEYYGEYYGEYEEEEPPVPRVDAFLLEDFLGDVEENESTIASCADNLLGLTSALPRSSLFQFCERSDGEEDDPPVFCEPPEEF